MKYLETHNAFGLSNTTHIWGLERWQSPKKVMLLNDMWNVSLESHILWITD